MIPVKFVGDFGSYTGDHISCDLVSVPKIGEIVKLCLWSKHDRTWRRFKVLSITHEISHPDTISRTTGQSIEIMLENI